jgi:CO/xanthine dehydrogenase Mo-binding subunit
MTDLDMTTVPIADSDGGNVTGYLFSFGAYGSTHVAVLASSVDDGLEAAIEWLDDNAPGLLSTVSEEDYAREAALLHVEWPPDEGTDSRDVDRVMRAAEADMTIVGWTTLKHGNCIPSWEWTFRELHLAETAIIRERYTAQWEES